MTPGFISIHLSLNPTPDELRRAREVLALMRSLSNVPDTRTAGGEDEVDETPVVPDAAAAAAAFAPVAAVPPAPPAVPAAPAAVPAPPAPVTLDKDGLPWDARVHASTKSTNQDGTWKAKRNVDDDTKAAVTAELRALYPAPAAAPAAPVAATVPPAPPATVPPAPPAAAPATPPAVGGADYTQASDGTFVGIMKKVAAAQKAGKLTHAQVVESCTSCGVAGLPALAKQPDLIPTVEALLDAVIQAAG